VIPTHRPCVGRGELDAVGRVFDSRWLGMGAVTKAFEERLCEFLGAKHVIGVNTGTAALHVALAALDLAPGDEVIVPSLTFISSAQAILAAGARPIFCEVTADRLNIDVGDAIARATARTRAIMPVHYGGQVCDMDTLLPLARERQLWVVEDAAHAFGSSYKGRRVGTLGDITCFSFDPVKNITCGGGGAVATDNDGLARRILPRRNLGMDADSWSRLHDERNWYYEVVAPGYRYHLADLNAAIVQHYDEAFGDVGGLTLIVHDGAETFPFSYVIRVPDGRREALMRHLRERGIGSSVEFIPNHLHPLFAESSGRLPRTEQLYKEILTLPLYVEMTDADIEDVITAVRGFFR
jgi:dTDP-4-amino-4,6-dideoxygalactose transaminase